MADTKLTPQLREQANQTLRDRAAAKSFAVESETPCERRIRIGCEVDLVILIDTSASMQDEAVALSAAVERIVQALQPKCDYDLRVDWFGIEGTWEKTQFSQSYRSYLRQLGVADSVLRGRRRGTVINEGAQEDGARAMIDLAQHYDWRRGALRLLLYLGDEALEGGDPKTAEDVQAANDAIATTKAQGVKVFAYAGTGSDRTTVNRNTIYEFRRLAAATGGQAYAAPMQNLSQLQADLETVICTQDEPEGTDLPADLRPCFALCWGDGPEDQIETDDIEVLYLIASNPYRNIMLRDVTIMVTVVTDPAGEPVVDLPDGDPSVLIKPSRAIYFGDLPPYRPAAQTAPVEVARQVVLISRGARPGRYRLRIRYYHRVEFSPFRDTDRFKIELVAS